MVAWGGYAIRRSARYGTTRPRRTAEGWEGRRSMAQLTSRVHSRGGRRLLLVLLLDRGGVWVSCPSVFLV